MRDFTGWKYYVDFKGVNIGITLTSSDGVCESRTIYDLEVAEWLDAGNTPLPAIDSATTPDGIKAVMPA